VLRISIDLSGPAGSTLPQEKLLLQPRQRDLVLNVPLSFYTPLGKLLEDVSLSNKSALELDMVINSAAENLETAPPVLTMGETLCDQFYLPPNKYDSPIADTIN
jgi:hypothetical protein